MTGVQTCALPILVTTSKLGRDVLNRHIACLETFKGADFRDGPFDTQVHCCCQGEALVFSGGVVVHFWCPFVVMVLLYQGRSGKYIVWSLLILLIS